MKVTLKITLDVPEIETFSRGELAQLLFDDYINFVTVQHRLSAMKWAANNEGLLPTQLIMSHHELWADIADKAMWTFETESDK